MVVVQVPDAGRVELQEGGSIGKGPADSEEGGMQRVVGQTKPLWGGAIGFVRRNQWSREPISTSTQGPDV